MKNPPLRKVLIYAGVAIIVALTVLAYGRIVLSKGSSSLSPKSPNDISFFASVPGGVINLKTNWFTRYVEKRFHFNINWITAPSSDFQMKQSLLLESDNYPDVFWGGNMSPSDVMKYAKEGIFVPLNHLIKQYAPNVWKAIQTAPGMKDVVTAPDGNIYGLPAYNYCYHCDWSAKFWINTKLLSQYGLKIPTTTKEFTHVLKVFKQHGIDPLAGDTNGWNGDPTTFLMNAFIYDDQTTYLNVDNGKVIFAPVQSQWKDGLRYIHRLYTEGLIDRHSFSQQQVIVQRLVASNKVGIVPSGDIAGYISGGSTNPNYKYWKTVPPLKGPHGIQYAAFFGNAPTYITFAITNHTSKGQEIKLMKLLNFIYTPKGMEMLDFGPKGKYWTKAKKGKKGLNGKQALFNTKWSKFYAGGSQQNAGWNQMGPMYQSKIWRNRQVAYPPSEPNGSSTVLRLQTELKYAGHQPKKVYPGAVWIPTDELQQYAMYKNNINKYVKQWTSEFIVGNKSIDQDWTKYVKGLKNLGLKEYLQMSQHAMRKPFDTNKFHQHPDVVKYLSSIR